MPTQRASHANMRGKVVPKIGITAGGSRAALAQSLVGAGVDGQQRAIHRRPGRGRHVHRRSGDILDCERRHPVHGQRRRRRRTQRQAKAGARTSAAPATTTCRPIVGAETFDAAVLEFDVVPVGNTMSIRFVFASEEYPEFVDSDFNDVLAIYVNGVNCANYNGRPVAINSINENVNARVLHPELRHGARNTEFDGFTVPLDCVASGDAGRGRTA